MWPRARRVVTPQKIEDRAFLPSQLHSPVSSLQLVFCLNFNNIQDAALLLRLSTYHHLRAWYHLFKSTFLSCFLKYKVMNRVDVTRENSFSYLIPHCDIMLLKVLLVRLSICYHGRASHPLFFLPVQISRNKQRGYDRCELFLIVFTTII